MPGGLYPSPRAVAVAPVGRAPGCGPGGRGFESRPPPCLAVRSRRREGSGVRQSRKLAPVTTSGHEVQRGLGRGSTLTRMDGVRHTRYGWWLEDAGAVEATLPLEGDASADVASSEAATSASGRPGSSSSSSRRPTSSCSRAVSRTRPERAQRRLRLDALGRRADPARPRRRRARRSRCAARPRTPCAASARGAGERRRRLVPRGADAPRRDHGVAGRVVGRRSSVPRPLSARPRRWCR